MSTFPSAYLPPSTSLESLLTLTDDTGVHRFLEEDLSPSEDGRVLRAERGSWRLELELRPRRLSHSDAVGLSVGFEVSSAELRIRVINRGATARTVVAWEALQLSLGAAAPGPGGHELWAYCGATHQDRPDWVRPVDPGFWESGWLGMDASDYGGGNPVAALWNSDSSIAVGCLSPVPEVLGFPLERKGQGPAAVSVRWSADGRGAVAMPPIEPGHAREFPPLWLAASRHDGIALLAAWREAISANGPGIRVASEAAREPTWCAWGYERDFTLTQVVNALPKVAELGFSWFTLDDGWQSEEGDISLNPAKFPGGEAQMRELVAEVHRRGMKAMLWWIPLAADPQSQWWARHPDTLIRDERGQTSEITWWNNATLCPSHPRVIEETRRQLEHFYRDWGFDGLKIDGQHLNAVAPCHDPTHHHTDPLEPYRRLPEFWKMVKEVSEELRPGATILFCPCGTTYNAHTLPYFDIPVASDPSGSWQVRTKGMVFKALMGADCAFHGDHVELSDGERDFASTVGVGGILDTKFTWPPGSSNPSVLKPGGNFDLLPEGERRLEAWMSAWRTQRLDRAHYLLGAYRFGFEPLEVHVLEAGERWYYSCFAWPAAGEDSLTARWSGRLEFRGLPPGRWKVTAWAEGGDVVEQDRGIVDSGSAGLEVAVVGSLLLRLEKLV